MLLAALALITLAPAEIVVVASRPAQNRPLPGPVVADAALATMRGGLALPNGLNVAIGIDIQTRIDGLLALHTIYASEGALPGVRVFTDGLDPVPLAPATLTVTSRGTVGVPLLIVDRSPTGTTIVPTAATSAETVNLVNGDPSTWLSSEGQIQIPVTSNGPPVASQAGPVRLTTDERGAVVTLQAPMAEIRHLIGQTTGVVIANTADDRRIDTVSSVNVDLQGISPALLAGIFVAQRAVLAAFTR